MNYCVLYISPAGTTRHAAKVICEALAASGRQYFSIDIGCNTGRTDFRENLAGLANNTCLFVGSPVYASHAVPAIMECIKQLPAGTGSCSVPFVTWGAVTSGMALAEMAEALKVHGYPAVAAVKIVAEHSMLWQADNPLGRGRPDVEDDRRVRDMVRAIVTDMDAGAPKTLEAEALKYQPGPLQNIMAGLVLQSVRKVLPQIRLEREKCTLCGVCAAACPVEAIELSDGPHIKDCCIACYTCLRACPEHALEADFTKMEAGLAQRVKDFGEASETVVYRPKAMAG